MGADDISPAAWNYLRVRGEYDSPNSTKPVALELPPRARRIRYDP